MIHLPTSKSKIHIQSYIDKYSDSYQKSLEQLSSGNKYTSVNENPIEYCKSSRLQYLVQSNSGLLDNIAIGNDLLTVASNANETVNDNLLRIQDLCYQAANGTYSSEDKDKIIDEIRGRLEAINFTATNTSFNGKNLLDGSNSSILIQLSTKSGDSLNLADALIDTQTVSLDIDLDESVTGETWTNEDIYEYIDNINLALDNVTGSITSIGNYSLTLDSATQNLTNTNENLTELRSVISDADTAEVCSEEIKYQILQETSVNILAQSNQMSQSVLSLLNY